MKVNVPNIDTAVVALSGGADSIALLHYLVKNSKIKIHAVHVNHNFQEFSREWASFCSTFCQSLGVEFSVVELNLDKKTENEARKHRYDVLKSFGSNIITGHHGDDQVETFFLKILRGSGISGLGGMKFKTKMQNFTIYRPLLDNNKFDIINYCHDNVLDYVSDPSNDTSDYDRNYFRNEVLNMIDTRFPNFRKALLKSMFSLHDADNCLNDLAEIDLNNTMVDNAISIELIKNSNLSESRIRNMLLYFMKKNDLTVNCGELVAFSKKITNISYNGKIELIGRGQNIRKLKQHGKKLILI